MHLELASLPIGEETVARKKVHFSTLSSQQTGFHFESEVVVYPGIPNKAHWLWHIGRKRHYKDRTTSKVKSQPRRGAIARLRTHP
jgi:hypothetical protein